VVVLADVALVAQWAAGSQHPWVQGCHRRLERARAEGWELAWAEGWELAWAEGWELAWAEGWELAWAAAPLSSI